MRRGYLSNLYGSTKDTGELKVNMIRLDFGVRERMPVSYEVFNYKVMEFLIITQNQQEAIDLTKEFYLTE